ncbi:hypothetical protein G7Y89_g1401 [Cudoniella acicularis]|uniref:Transcription initiation factor TFIID subunit 2 n=1 Tax=Cudoniella acicularis TaxID=354080 RepID=A0A8H4RW54_9HELO|nr:hypothetical protein G7Y89_g1401 [Cudoniella acicularis]
MDIDSTEASMVALGSDTKMDIDSDSTYLADGMDTDEEGMTETRTRANSSGMKLAAGTSLGSGGIDSNHSSSVIGSWHNLAKYNMAPSSANPTSSSRASFDASHTNTPRTARHSKEISTVSLASKASSVRSHKEYLDSLEMPTQQMVERISEVQQQKESENIKRRLSVDHPDLSAAERERAASLIQRNYRGHRERRMLAGMSLDPSTRWVEAIKEARYRHLLEPKARKSLDEERKSLENGVNGNETTRNRRYSAARQNWKKIALITRRAGGDEDSSESEESDEDDEHLSLEEKDLRRKRKLDQKLERQKAAKMMDLQYFLEMVDLKHRYGSNLRTYHEEWKKSDTKENFFYWLDYGEGRYIECAACPRERLDREQVRYLSKEERLDYLVKINKDGRLCWAKNGALIDTTEKYKDSIHGIVPDTDDTPAYAPPDGEVSHGMGLSRPSSSTSTSSSAHGSSDNESARAKKYATPAFDNAKGMKKVKHVSASTIFNKLLRGSVQKNTWIFVADTSFRLYVGIKQSGAFQHSSFLHGSRISAAGLIKIKNGRLSKLSPLSGHYRPPVSNFKAFVHSLKDAGVDMSHVSISRSYAVLVGLEAYVKTRRRGKKLLEKIVHHRDKIIAPVEVAKREEEARDKSESAERERKFLEMRQQAEEEQRDESRADLLLLKKLRIKPEEPRHTDGGDPAREITSRSTQAATTTTQARTPDTNRAISVARSARAIVSTTRNSSKSRERKLQSESPRIRRSSQRPDLSSSNRTRVRISLPPQRCASPKQAETATQTQAPPPPRKPTDHHQKVVNGIKHELDRLQPNSADLKDEKRKLRSQEGTRFKSELSAYFPEYDEVIGNEPKEDHILNLDTPIIIIDSAKISTKQPSSPQKTDCERDNEFPLKDFPESLFTDLHNAQRVDFSFIDKNYKEEGGEDPLSDAYFEQIHRRPERQEKAIRNTDRGRAQHEKDQVIRLLEGLQGHDWLKLMGVSGVTDSKKKEYEPARDHFIKGCEAILEKFRTWREEEKRRKLEKEQALAEAEAEEEMDEGAESDGDPPDYSDVDASAARQLHEEAIARSGPSSRHSDKRAKAEPAPLPSIEVEKDFKSFFAKPHLREAALGKHRRSARSVSAWGHPVPEVPVEDFELPEEYRDEETLKAHARKKRRIRRRDCHATSPTNTTSRTTGAQQREPSKNKTLADGSYFYFNFHTMPGLLLKPMDMDPPVEPAAPPPKEPSVPEYGFVVSHQKLELNLDFSTQTLTGRTVITILPQTKDLSTIKIDARQCSIAKSKVLVDGIMAEFDYEDPMEAMDIPEHIMWGADQYELQKERLKNLTEDARSNGILEITIPRGVRVEEVDPFSENAATPVAQRAMGAAARASVVEGGNGPLSATPTMTPRTAAEQAGRFQPLTITISFTTKYFRDGLHFVGLTEGDTRYPYAYTRHSIDPGSASCIFPCVDDPAMRCTWDIYVKCSRTLGDALKKKPAPLRIHPRGTHHGRSHLANGLVNGVRPVEDYQVPLSEEEKLLEMVVVCSGELMSENIDFEDPSKKVQWFQISRLVAAQQIGFSIGPFETIDLSVYRETEDGEKLGQGQALQVLGYCLPGRVDQVRHTCGVLVHAVDYFTLSFGSYPFSQYSMAFIDDQIRDVEHTASLSLCSSRLLYSEDIIDPEIENTRTLVHAIASQWFGVSITPEDRGDRWITIGLSHYMTGLYMKQLCGHNDYAFRQKILADKLVEIDIDRPSLYALGETLCLGPFEMEFMVLKAPLVLFILDKRIIKASGSAGLTRVLSKLVMAANTGQPEESVLSTPSFRRMVEKVTKYRQTEPFWNQWILGAGCPRFQISQKFNKKRLCVEMTISQKQDTLPTQRPLKKESFQRELKEELNEVYAGEMQPVFTGPLTIRIHEADGTPYEHIVEIREGVAKIEIPYNTKYKRLKRSRRQKERMNAGSAVDISGEGAEDALYYCLGDVLQSPAEVAEWGLADWDRDAETRMDLESYEWIRIDADFEWLCDKNFVSMPAYMYVSQLQQDRDVVAQQESMMFLKSMGPHPLVATFLVRTLMDTRYFHGIRTMAAEFLSTHANSQIKWIGRHHLEKAYQEFFCYPGTKTPRPNDFSNKQAYLVEASIPRAMAMIHNQDGRCPPEARHFLLDMLRFNDNGNNEYSDYHKVANLLSALAQSLVKGEKTASVPAKKDSALGDDGQQIVPGDSIMEDDAEARAIAENGKAEADAEFESFKISVLQELDRYARMDEWMASYQNIYTTTVLDCKRLLMKQNVIPIEPLDFIQYLNDGTADLVRIKAFAALIDLGFITNNSIACLLLNHLSTDSSPYTRSHLFEVFCLGLATVAFGENKAPEPAPAHKIPNADGDVDMLNEGEPDGLIVQDASTEARKAKIMRTTSIDGATAALKEELKNNKIFKQALWQAVESTQIGTSEQVDLLDICGILYDAVESMIVKLKLPRYWTVTRGDRGKGHLVFKEIGKVRTAPRKPIEKPVINVVKPPRVSLPPVTPAATPVRLSFTTNGGAMRPPKRPIAAVERTLSSEGSPTKRKWICLRTNPQRMREILNALPRPTIPRGKPSSSRSSPAPKPSPKPSPRPMASIPAAPEPSTISVSPAPVHTPNPVPVKNRKPLPDSTGRKPLPDSSSSGRKPLPDSSGRKPLPDSVPRIHGDAALPVKKTGGIMLKLNTRPAPRAPPSP